MDESIGDENLKHTSSAADTIEILYVFLLEIKNLEWPKHDQTLMIITQIITPEIQNLCDLYYQEASENIQFIPSDKIEELKLDKKIIHTFCNALNNLEYIALKVPNIIEVSFIS